MSVTVANFSTNAVNASVIVSLLIALANSLMTDIANFNRL